MAINRVEPLGNMTCDWCPGFTNISGECLQVAIQRSKWNWNWLRDSFEYWVTVEDRGKQSSVRMIDETLPSSAAPLIDRLLAARDCQLSSAAA